MKTCWTSKFWCPTIRSHDNLGYTFGAFELNVRTKKLKVDNNILQNVFYKRTTETEKNDLILNKKILDRKKDSLFMDVRLNAEDKRWSVLGIR